MTAANPAEDQAARYDAWFDSAWGSHAWAVESAAILRALGPLTGRRVVDVGCGTGRLLASLRASGADAIGLDRDPGMLAIAATRAPRDIVRADAIRLPFADASVDIALAVTVLEFASNPAAVLDEMARIVRPGGRLIAGVLNPHSPWGWIDERQHRQPEWAGACFVPRDHLLALGRRYGDAHLRSSLFSWRGMPLPRLLGAAVERAGRLAPRLGAFQLLTIDVSE